MCARNTVCARSALETVQSLIRSCQTEMTSDQTQIRPLSRRLYDQMSLPDGTSTWVKICCALSWVCIMYIFAHLMYMEGARRCQDNLPNSILPNAIIPNAILPNLPFYPMPFYPMPFMHWVKWNWVNCHVTKAVSGQFTQFHFTQCHYTQCHFTQPAILPNAILPNANLPNLPHC